MKADEVQVGCIVKTRDLGETTGMMAHEHHLKNRVEDKPGRVFAFLEPENDVALVFVRHGSKEAVYFTYELDLMADPVHE